MIRAFAGAVVLLLLLGLVVVHSCLHGAVGVVPAITVGLLTPATTSAVGALHMLANSSPTGVPPVGYWYKAVRSQSWLRIQSVSG